MNPRDELTEAMMTAARKLGHAESGDIAGDWIVLLHVENLEDPENDGYVILFSRNPIPEHIALGLVGVAKGRIAEGVADDG